MSKQHATVARFWECAAAGNARIKLRRGQSVSHTRGGPTDEGYHWVHSIYSYDGTRVTVEWSSDSRDCDGRYLRGGVATCFVDELSAGHKCTETGLVFPKWRDVSRRQRDLTAEAAGY